MTNPSSAAPPGSATADSVVLRKLASMREVVGPAQRRLVDFVLEHPEEVIHLSIGELARRATVSEATVVRLFQETGHKGFPDFKIRLSRSLVARPAGFDYNIRDDAGPAEVLTAVVHTALQALQQTHQVVPEEELRRAVALLAGARRIEFIGSGGSGVVARDGSHKFLRLGIPVSASTDGHDAAQVCAVLEPGDVVLAVSHSGETQDVVEAVQLAREAGAAVIALTRFAPSRLARMADVVLPTLSTETNHRSEGFGSRIAQLVLLDALMLSVYLARRPGSEERVRRARAALASKRG